MIQNEKPVEQTKVYAHEEVFSQGEGVVFKGAPNGGVKAGSCTSPQLDAALNQ